MPVASSLRDEVQTYEVTLPEGTPYRRLVHRGDRRYPRRREQGAGEPSQEYRGAAARDLGGASQASVSI